MHAWARSIQSRLVRNVWEMVTKYLVPRDPRRATDSEDHIKKRVMEPVLQMKFLFCRFYFLAR